MLNHYVDSHLPHHPDSYRDGAAEPTCNMPFLFPDGMLFFRPQESTKMMPC